MADRLFTKTHEWVTTEAPIVTVGITDFAQSQLGDVVFLELPKAGRKLDRGEAFGVIESVKAASDLNSPVAGTVTAVNDKLATNPELVNSDPFGEGWLLKIEIKGALPSDLLDEATYKREAEASAH